MLGTAAGAGRTAAAPRPDRPAVDQLVFRWLPRTRFGALVVPRDALLVAGDAAAGQPDHVQRGRRLPAGHAVGEPAAAAGGMLLLFVGALAAVSLANQFGFEGSAYAANIAAGVPGRVELQSRAAGFSMYVLPLLLVIAVVVGVVVRPSGRRSPPSSARCSASFGVGLAVVLPVSVRGAYALPGHAPTRSPCRPAAAWPRACSPSARWLAAIVATLPLLIAAYLLGDVWLWIGLPVGHRRTAAWRTSAAPGWPAACWTAACRSCWPRSRRTADRWRRRMFHVNPVEPGARIHSSDPFATPEQDKSPVRRLRGRLAAAVTLWTTPGPAGLTVSLDAGRRRRAGPGARAGRRGERLLGRGHAQPGRSRSPRSARATSNWPTGSPG